MRRHLLQVLVDKETGVVRRFCARIDSLIQKPTVSLHKHTCSELLTCVLADFITALEFDHTGKYLAIGDRSGKLQIVEARAKEKAAVGPTHKGNRASWFVLICLLGSLTRKATPKGGGVASFWGNRIPPLCRIPKS